jgi:hypothetical protein
MDTLTSEYLTWLGILFCLTQSATFSGLNLALFGISRLRLEVEASARNPAALRILRMRQDANFLLTTILWGNVGINVLLTLLSDSVLTGVSAFFFSTVLITFFGEIFPQAYFSRHAMKMGHLLAPVLRFYQYLLYPVAKPSALLLDRWLGPEGLHLFQERDLRTVIRKHIEAEESDITEEGQPVDPKSIISLPAVNGRPVFPQFRQTPGDHCLQQIHASGKKWVIITNLRGDPELVMNANAFLRTVLMSKAPVDPFRFCHRPILVTDMRTLLGLVLSRLQVSPQEPADDVIDDDLILIWGEQKRVITGSDILGRLLRGIATRQAGRPST